MLYHVIYCCLTNYPNPRALQQQTCIISVSVSQESMYSLHECLWLKVSNKVAIKVSAPAAIISRLTRERVYFQAHVHGCWRASGLFLCLARGIVSLLCGPLHSATHSTTAGFSWSKRVKRESKMDQSFCKLISEAASHHFWHISFVERKSVHPAHTWGEGITVGVNTMRWTLLGATSEAACHTGTFSNSWSLVQSGQSWISLMSFVLALKTALYMSVTFGIYMRMEGTLFANIYLPKRKAKPGGFAHCPPFFFNKEDFLCPKNKLLAKHIARGVRDYFSWVIGSKV